MWTHGAVVIPEAPDVFHIDILGVQVSIMPGYCKYKSDFALEIGRMNMPLCLAATVLSAYQLDHGHQ
jgi:hypothetical protein